MKNIMLYDTESDSLLLRKKGTKVEECLNDGSDVCILEFDKENNIIGLELLDIHKTFGIPLKILKNLKDSKINIRYEKAKKIAYINIVLIYEKEIERIAVPIMVDLRKQTFECKGFMACASC